MWTSNRRHVYRVCGIRFHPNGVFSNVLMQNQRHENRKTSGWSKSAFSVSSMYRTSTFWPTRCFFDSHVAGFASTHSKTRHSDVIWCHKHDRHDDGSMSTLMTKLLRKQWIITICPLVSDCTIGYNFSVSCNTRFKSRRTIQSHSLYVSAKIHFDTFIVNKISLLVSSTYGTITFWPVRCFSIIVSLLCHQHMRKQAGRM